MLVFQGNVLMTSLMERNSYGGTATPGCGLGAIGYENNFDPIPTTCFGPGGYYEMSEMPEGLWVFFSQNFGDQPLTFGVVGNLGHDGSGVVHHFEYAAHTWVGFVKSACDADLTDPSVNHMIVVDSGASIRSRPVHTCGGLACEGSSTNFDDDEVSNIAPGSTIMYLVYSVINLDDGGATTNCMTFEQHRAVFDASIACIFEEGARAAGDHCDYDSWSQSIQSLIPHAYTFSAGASDTSADGATAMAMRFGDDWTRYIYHACVTGGSYDANAVTCEHSNAAGNCIYDGGSDMYDIVRSTRRTFPSRLDCKEAY